MAEHGLSSLTMLTACFTAEHIEAAARRTGFVKRASKITGKLFLALVTFGVWSDATATLAQLAAKVTQLAEQLEVSPEAIYQRRRRLSRTSRCEPLRRAAAARWGRSQRRGRGSRWRGTLGGPTGMVGSCAPEVSALQCRVHCLYSALHAPRADSFLSSFSY